LPSETTSAPLLADNIDVTIYCGGDMADIKGLPKPIQKVAKKLDDPVNSKGKFEVFIDALPSEIEVKLNKLPTSQRKKIIGDFNSTYQLSKFGVDVDRSNNTFRANPALVKSAASRVFAGHTPTSNVVDSFTTTRLGLIHAIYDDGSPFELPKQQELQQILKEHEGNVKSMGGQMYSDFQKAQQNAKDVRAAGLKCPIAQTNFCNNLEKRIATIANSLLKTFDSHPLMSITVKEDYDKTLEVKSVRGESSDPFNSFKYWGIIIKGDLKILDGLTDNDLRNIIAHEIGHHMIKDEHPVFDLTDSVCDDIPLKYVDKMRHEYEADRLGLLLIYMNGGDLSSYIDTLNKLDVLSGKVNSTASKSGRCYYNSHPPIQDRIKHAKKYISKLGSANKKVEASRKKGTKRRPHMTVKGRKKQRRRKPKKQIVM
jgi:hypothetical protein